MSPTTENVLRMTRKLVRFDVLFALSKQTKILESQEAGFCDVFIMSFFTLFLIMCYL